jgi:uncharacterized protein
MRSVLTVASISVDQGQRVMQEVAVPTAGRTITVPVIAINGERDGPRVAITAGIHGAEYVGIEAARRLGTGIEPHEVAGSIVVVPIANTTAFHARSIYTSGLDNSNLNRCFPGNPNGTPSEVLASWLFQNIIRPSQYYVDLHGGDLIEALVPFVLYVGTPDFQVEETAQAMALATGIPRVIRSVTTGSTYAAATAAGIPAILAEVGGQGVWSEDLVQQHAEGSRRVLRHLRVLSGEQPPVDRGRPIYETFAWMRAEAAGLFHPWVQVGDSVERGQTIGRITDYFGNERQRLAAVAGGEVGFLVTSLAINAGDPLLAIIS